MMLNVVAIHDQSYSWSWTGIHLTIDLKQDAVILVVLVPIGDDSMTAIETEAKKRIVWRSRVLFLSIDLRDGLIKVTLSPKPKAEQSKAERMNLLVTTTNRIAKMRAPSSNILISKLDWSLAEKNPWRNDCTKHVGCHWKLPFDCQFFLLIPSWFGGCLNRFEIDNPH